MVFGLWSNPATKSKEVLTEVKEQGTQLPESKVLSDIQSPSVPVDATPGPSSDATSESVTDHAPSEAQVETDRNSQSTPSITPTPQTSAPAPTFEKPEPLSRPRAQQRFSWRSLVHPKGVQNPKPAPPTLHEQAEKEAVARREYAERRIVRARSEKRAHESALVLRDLIVGPFAAPSVAPPKSSKIAAYAVPPKRKVDKVKAQLMQPKSAQKVIAQLRLLSSSDEAVVVGKTASGEDIKAVSNGPIHAVCLPFTDAEAEEKRFAKLDKVFVTASSAKPTEQTAERSLNVSAIPSRALDGITSVTTSSFDKLKEMLSDLDVISLITVPNWGLGEPANAPGLLSGAVPTAKAVMEGVEQITPQLMALGYATGKSILPSHAGVYPPTDRMSVITYWWGLEVVIPESSVQYLSNVPSIAHTVVNFLTALSVANGGVREIMPFVRYISQYIDAEFNAIREQDQGKGVVCAATWIMPAALVPRPWDFPDPPADASGDKDTSTPVPPAQAHDPGLGPIMLTPPLPGPNHVPILSSSVTSTSAESVPANPAEGVPGVTVTPPTPPASETLGKSAGGAFAPKVVSPADAADMVDENGTAAFGEGGDKEGVVNGLPLFVVA
ncbi:hypothetical protein C8Q80DRAFT_1272280 [Daedaleopsis nitida]|nr:hypothetical protein C8Q80DRAFT_1272280 [Daedaleopsis nitida]